MASGSMSLPSWPSKSLCSFPAYLFVETLTCAKHIGGVFFSCSIMGWAQLVVWAPTGWQLQHLAELVLFDNRKNSEQLLTNNDHTSDKLCVHLCRHPGGKVISYLVGTDGSQAFHEFHTRSERAQKLLKALPSRPADGKVSEPSALLQDYEKLRAELVKEGMFDPSIPHVVYRLVEILALHFLGGYLVVAGFPAPLVLLGLLILGIGQGRCGWFMHEGGHYSLTGNITIDRYSFFFSFLLFFLLLSLSPPFPVC